jgi:hypothetical protein
MKALKLFLLVSVLLYGCGEDTPPKYLEAKVLEVSCKPIAQITGTALGEKWKGYDNVVVINNPVTDGIVIPSDSVFYFRAYELTGPNECSNSTGLFPGINIRVLDYSVTKP